MISVAAAPEPGIRLPVLPCRGRMVSMQVIALDVQDISQLRSLWEVEQAAHRHDRSLPLLRPLTSVTSTYADPTPRYHREPLAAVVDGQVVGVADLGWSVGENEHLADLEISVLPDHRRRGVATTLHAEATRRRRLAGRGSDMAEVYSPVDGDDSPGMAFASSLGYSDAHGEHHLVLDLPARVPDGPGHPGYEIVTWTDRCPDELLDHYLEMRNRMNADVPIGELDYTYPVLDAERLRTEEDRIGRSYGAVVAAARRTSDGVFGGYSLTYLPHDTDEALQDDTLVMPDHRGRSLGLALKSATLDLVQRDHPERGVYHSWTDPENRAMYRTNQRFGYRVVEAMHEMQVKDGS